MVKLLVFLFFASEEMRSLIRRIFCFIFWFVFLLVIIGLFKSKRMDVSGGYNLTVITQINEFNDIDNVELLKGEKVNLSFKANNNRLGILSMRFNVHGRINNGLIRFRIKEFDNEDWYYTNDYEIAKFQDGLNFPFGFPEIINSRGKEYMVEIESLDGVYGNSVQLLAVNNSFLAKYSYSKEYLSQNKNEIPIFLFRKLFSILKLLSVRDYLLSLVVSFFIVRICSSFIKAALHWFNLFFKKSFFGLKDILKGGSMVLFLIILLLTIFSRYFVSYKKSENLIKAPESIFYLSPVGKDFYTGVVTPSNNLLNGRNFLDEVSSYGPAVSVTLAPLLKSLQNYGVCNSVDVIPCHLSLYKSYLSIFLFLFLLFLVAVLKKTQKKYRSLVLLFTAIFVLQTPFSFAVERGNLDLVLSILIGFMFYFRLKVPVKDKILRSVCVGLIVGYLSNAKLFILPFAIAEILFSGSILLTFLSFLVSFVGFSYLPILYGVNTDVSSVINAIMFFKVGSDGNFSSSFYLTFNHSIRAISTLFTNCISKGTCLTKFGITSFISKFWFVLVFIFPFFPKWGKDFRGLLKSFLILIRKLWESFLLGNKQVYILAYILSVAVINLIPTSVYMYRLVYSIPILLLLLGEVGKSPLQKKLLMKSSLCLMVAGLWYSRTLSNGFSFFDPRLVNIFVILHYYFLIKLGVIKVNEK